MPLSLPRAIFGSPRDGMDPAATKSATQSYPLLPTLSVKAQLASCVSMTRAFVAKTLPRTKPLPLPLPLPVESPGDSARVDELLVVAVRRMVRVDRRGSAKPSLGALGRSAGSWKGSLRAREPRRRVQCSVRYGSRRKQARASDSAGGVFHVDAKFAFARQGSAPVCGEPAVEIEIAAPQPQPQGAPETLARLVVDVELAFLAEAEAAPLRRSCAVEAADGSGALWEVELLLHRLPVDGAAAQEAAAALAHSQRAVDDDADLEAFGAALPHLWYMF